jgi:hypothetical protein
MHCLIAPAGAAPAPAPTPAWLDGLLARATELPPCAPDPMDAHTPAERWLGRLHGLADDAALPLAAWRLNERTRPWAFVSPVHLRVEATQVSALPQALLDLSEAESRALFDALAPLFPADEGWERQWLSPLTWAVSHADLAGLQLASLGKAVDRPITPWLPQDRRIRRWTNEAQMLWHTHPVNAQRSPAVNSIWWWGAGRFAGEPPAALQQLDDWPATLDLQRGDVLALAGFSQVRSFEIGTRPWWKFGPAGRAAEVLGSL